MKSVLEITHHSGRKRWLNMGEGPWEWVEANDQGQAVIQMMSGGQHVTTELVPDILAAMGVKIARVRATIAEPLPIEDKSIPEPESDSAEIDPDIIPPQVKGNS